MNTQEFIEKTKRIHGDKYDYSKVEYVNAKTKVCIICPEHGEFWQTPNGHLSGHRCPKCVGGVRSNNDDFVKKAKEIHGDRYDYSKVEYKNNRTKVCIICPEHGEFWMTPSNHINKSKPQGCSKCADLQRVKTRSSTTEYFIKKACEVHGDRYDYSKVDYTKAYNKVCIICPEHGEFWQTANVHLGGAKCPKCVGGVKFNTSDFINKAREVHGDRYDYSKVNYVNSVTKVCIICSEHGEFWQKPVGHLRGGNCPICSGSFKRTTEWFINKAREVHGDKYDYSKVEYIKAKEKVCIICPEHGEFWQEAFSHLSGAGCPKCVGRMMGTKEWIERAREIHGDKYDYSKVEYIDSTTKVCIICPEHGEFWQIPPSHLAGNGCKKCANEELSDKQRLSLDDFLKRAREIHGDKYDYSKVEYINAHTKICIICPEHGEFWQEAFSHLSGAGCFICNNGYNREYKFNLLEEFIDEYRLRDFLMTNDENLIYVILRNIEKINPKFNPIVKDIDRVLRSDSTNPIEDLEDKYRAPDETVTSDTVVEENNTTTIDDIDLDDDDAVEAFISNTTTTVEKTEPTIDELTRARENEINLINRIEHMLTPEDRQFIKDKFLNDKRRNWMLERDKK